MRALNEAPTTVPATLGATCCAAIILLTPTVAAIGTFERLGLQVASICGLLAISYELGRVGRSRRSRS